MSFGLLAATRKAPCSCAAFAGSMRERKIVSATALFGGKGLQFGIETSSGLISILFCPHCGGLLPPSVGLPPEDPCWLCGNPSIARFAISRIRANLCADCVAGLDQHAEINPAYCDCKAPESLVASGRCHVVPGGVVFPTHGSGLHCRCCPFCGGRRRARDSTSLAQCTICDLALPLSDVCSTCRGDIDRQR